ncbi:SMP-30/gluconolactonase/LRE family protein [Aspergillus lucknowensis]|uniref:SMP-30/Gluconolactonase/LRE-like region domain-containing protein n=1 Tax=Aspergillus lucknowensis TaxID=176173 RepID=A0ABR4LSF4_9EURO
MPFLNPLPPFMNGTLARWAYVSLAGLAALPGQFNRSALEAPWATSDISNPGLSRTLAYLNTTDFVAYDRKFLDIIGPDATIEHVQKLAFQSHEAPCYIKDTNQLFFVEWGPPGGENGTHPWQYLLDVETNELRKITTDPPTYNAHGCVVYDGALYVVTDGHGDEESAQLVKIDPRTLKREVLLNNYLVQPFGGFNDLEIDPRGNFYLTDSRSGWGRGLVDFALPTNPTVYFVERDTYRIKPVHITDGNANGVAISPDGDVIYIPDTGVSSYYPVHKSPYGKRELWAFDVAQSGAVLTNKRLLSNPISYFYDGVRVSRNGWIFCGAGDGVDVIDPQSGFTLGTIRVGGGENLAVSLAFGQNELWIVGRGGVWHVKGIRERLDREW